MMRGNHHGSIYPNFLKHFRWMEVSRAAPRSLSDFGITGCKQTAPSHFSPLYWAIVRLFPSESGKNWPRRGRFSLSVTKVRQAPSGYPHKWDNAVRKHKTIYVWIVHMSANALMRKNYPQSIPISPTGWYTFFKQLKPMILINFPGLSRD